MLYDVKLRIKTPVVGNSYDATRRLFAFPREDSAWALDQNTKHTWCGLMENAVESLGVDIDPDIFRWPRSLLLPSLHLLEMNGTGGRKVRHEMIPKNVILTIPIMVRMTDGETVFKQPTEKQIYEIFRFIGQYEGISPFGSAAGFGLFDIKGVYPVGRTIIDVGELPEGLQEGVAVRGQKDGDRQARSAQERALQR